MSSNEQMRQARRLRQPVLGTALKDDFHGTIQIDSMAHAHIDRLEPSARPQNPADSFIAIYQ